MYTCANYHVALVYEFQWWMQAPCCCRLDNTPSVLHGEVKKMSPDSTVSSSTQKLETVPLSSRKSGVQNIVWLECTLLVAFPSYVRGRCKFQMKSVERNMLIVLFLLLNLFLNAEWYHHCFLTVCVIKGFLSLMWLELQMKINLSEKDAAAASLKENFEKRLLSRKNKRNKLEN